MLEQDKLKSYHRFVVDDKKFVFNAEDIELFEVDDLIWDYISAIENHRDDSVDHNLSERYKREQVNEILDDLRRVNLIANDSGKIKTSAAGVGGYTGLTLNVTHGCNLSCSYCFASQGDYGLGRSKMSPDTAIAAIDWFMKRRRKDISPCVLFFGGEPMMNVPTIQVAVNHAKKAMADAEKPPLFQLVTNGTLLNDKNIRFLEENNIDIQVSLDGLPHVNDQYRIFPNGKCSHDVVAKGIKRLRNAGKKVSVRATITHGNGKFFESALHLADDIKATAVHFEPASLSPCGSGVDEDDMQDILEHWKKVADECMARFGEGEIWPVAKFAKLIGRMLKKQKSQYGCTAGQGAVAIDPLGDIYPCHRFVGNSEWRMGNVHDQEFDKDIVQQFVENTVENRLSCQKCWARYLCGGRCAHEALDVTGDITEPDPLRCKMMKQLCELSLQLYARLEHSQKEYLERQQVEVSVTDI